MPVIKGHHNRKQIFLDVVLIDMKRDIYGMDEFSNLSVQLEPVRALVDTGATATSITPAAAMRLGLRMAGRRRVQVAGGSVVVPYYLFKIGFVVSHDAEFNSPSINFHVLPEAIVGSTFLFQNSPFDILLGMDAISQGDLSICRDGIFSFEI